MNAVSFINVILPLVVKFNISIFVHKWNNSTLNSLKYQEASVDISELLKRDLREASTFFLYKKNESKNSARELFITYLAKNNIMPIKTGGIIIELPTSGEKSAINYFLLTKRVNHYYATKFLYTSHNGWKKEGSNVLSTQYVANIVSSTSCYPKGNNGDAVIITEFTGYGNKITSHYFVRGGFCVSLNNLEAI